MCYWILLTLFTLVTLSKFKKEGENDGTEQSQGHYVKANLYLYFDMGTLHGLNYLPMSSNVLDRLFWILLTGSFLSIATYLTFLTFQDLYSNPLETILSASEKTIFEVQYPTITVCPNQFYDRWNLPRILLNQVGRVIIY